MRDTSITICKAIAIILVVIGHAGCPTWLSTYVYQFHFPIFFLCAGYCFKLAYMDNSHTFLAHRVTRLYWPFVKWSLFFLIIHNVLLWMGILSTQYGTPTGGVAHAYSWHEFFQDTWNVVFTMSGYDGFTCGAFWFFRSLFVASIGFLVGMCVFRKLRRSRDGGNGVADTPTLTAALVGITALLLIVWKIAADLYIPGIAGGGYRELLGVLLISVGFIISQNRKLIPQGWLTIAICLAVTVLGAIYFPSLMVYKTDFGGFFSLLLPAVAGFVLVHQLSTYIDTRTGKVATLVKRGLIYIGDRTLYIFAFHIIAFKLVSALKVAYYGLPWQEMGGHPVVVSERGDAFWLLYAIVGIALPLAWLEGYKWLAQRYDLSLKNCLRVALNFTIRFTICFFKLLYKYSKKFIFAIWDTIKGIYLAICDIIKASNPKEE